MATAASADRTCTLDPVAPGPVWRGWGTSLSWWANVVGGLPEPQRTQLCERVFRDLGLNIVRYEIGAGMSDGCDAMEPRARVPCMLRRDGSHDWNADANQQWVLRTAKSLGVDTFHAFVCSPPAWMTRSGSVTGGVDGGPNLRDDAMQAFASHVADALHHFGEQGMVFDSVSPMNEPESDWWKRGGRQAGCVVRPGAEQTRWVVEVDRALRSQGVHARVSAPEGWSHARSCASFDALGPEARQVLAHVSTHGYGDGAGRVALHQRCRDAGKPVWVTEYGDGDASGLTLARSIVRDLRELQPSAWLVWQAIDGGGGWGCLDMPLNQGGTEVHHNRKFDMLAQFSRFIRPGARLVNTSDDRTVAALQPDRLTLVTVGGDAADTLHIDLSRFQLGGEPARVVRSSADEAQVELAPIAPRDGRLQVDVPANSVVTVVVAVRPRAEQPKPTAPVTPGT